MGSDLQSTLKQRFEEITGTTPTEEILDPEAAQRAVQANTYQATPSGTATRRTEYDLTLGNARLLVNELVGFRCGGILYWPESYRLLRTSDFKAIDTNEEMNSDLDSLISYLTDAAASSVFRGEGNIEDSTVGYIIKYIKTLSGSTNDAACRLAAYNAFVQMKEDISALQESDVFDRVISALDKHKEQCPDSGNGDTAQAFYAAVEAEGLPRYDLSRYFPVDKNGVWDLSKCAQEAKNWNALTEQAHILVTDLAILHNEQKALEAGESINGIALEALGASIRENGLDAEAAYNAVQNSLDELIAKVEERDQNLRKELANI